MKPQSTTRPAAEADAERQRKSGLHAAQLARSPLWSRPGFLVRRLNQINYALFMEECAPFDITPIQYGMLTVLSMNPGLDQAALGAELGIDRTTVTGVLARLTRRGLVARHPSPRDRRKRLAALTAEGERLTDRMKAAMQRSQERLIEALTPDERRAFMDYLVRLVEANNDVGRALLRFP